MPNLEAPTLYKSIDNTIILISKPIAENNVLFINHYWAKIKLCKDNLLKIVFWSDRISKSLAVDMNLLLVTDTRKCSTGFKLYAGFYFEILVLLS